ncbi:major facilitator superfamily domain-containing protein [Bisporella sp. PMI_857]|nr:major facilitator superfamily domain-containing protein [Bisporella sp. PMI_857]
MGSGSEAFLSSFTPEEDKAIRQKVDWRFVWLIDLMYTIKNVDYQNATSVKVLQISYIIFEAPSNLVLKKMTPRNWQFRIIFSWGVVLACHEAVKNKEGLYAARFFLGTMEVGMFPGLVAQLCSWYRTWAGVVGLPLTYGVSYMNEIGGLSAWEWAYLLEGIITILFSFVVYFEYLEARPSENAPTTADSPFNLGEGLASLRDLRTYSFMCARICMNLASLGFAGLPRNQLLNIPPVGASVVAIIFAGWFMGRAYLPRPAFIMFICVGASVLFVLLAAMRDKYAVYIGCIFGSIFRGMYIIPFWPCARSSTLVGTTGTAFTLAFQSCLFQSNYPHNGYNIPFAVCAAATGAGWIFSMWTWGIRRPRLEARKEGRVFADDDVKVLQERKFYGKGLVRRNDVGAA